MREEGSRMLTQKRWRMVGTASLIGSAGMLMYALRNGAPYGPVPCPIVYWGVFVLLVLAALFTALLDIRYNLVRYTMAKREVFREILGEESFRRSLREGYARMQEHEDDGDGDEGE